MARKEYYVAPSGLLGGYHVQHEGQSIGQFNTQALAIEFARQRAHHDWNVMRNPAQVHVSRPGGQFRTEWTYGNDPARYVG